MSSSKSSFLLAVSPLLCGHMLVPPLSYFYGEHLDPTSPLYSIFHFFYQNITPTNLFYVNNVLSLTLDPEKDFSLDKASPWFTHIFVHATYEHMLLNLQGLMIAGYPVYSSLGPGPMLSLFLLGGAMSELPSTLHEHQNGDRRLPGTAVLPLFIRRGLGSVLSWLRGGREIHCGSSGGVFALLGAGGALSLRKVFRALIDCHLAGWDALGGRLERQVERQQHQLSQHSRVEVESKSVRLYSHTRTPPLTPLPASSTRIFLVLKAVAQRLFSIDNLLLCGQVSSQCLTIAREVAYLTAAGAGDGAKGSMVNYAAHVQGYLFGLVSTAGCLFLMRKK